ncbi:MAG: hypothetical protein RR676_14160 [Acinetobacter sp.]
MNKNKYDWSNVPKEVNWITTSFHNRAKIGFINKPLKDKAMLCWCSRWMNGEQIKLSDVSEFTGDWKDSLEQRPVEQRQ